MSVLSADPHSAAVTRPAVWDPTRRQSIVDADPGLVAGLDERELTLARRYAGVLVAPVATGPWDPSALPQAGADGLGVLVLDGMFTREARFGDGVALEILGPDDLLPPGIPSGGNGSEEGLYNVMRPVTVAILDDTFAQVATRIPGLTTALLARAHGRSDRLARHLAISALPRVEDRLLGLLSLLAERFGHVGSDGVHLALPLTHAVLGLLIGARRPTVTLAVTALRERGAVARIDGGGWLLPRAGPTLAGLPSAGAAWRGLEGLG